MAVTKNKKWWWGIGGFIVGALFGGQILGTLKGITGL